MNARKVGAALFTLLAVTSCGDAEGSDEVVLYGAAEYAFGCEGWYPATPTAALSAFDVTAWGAAAKDSVMGVVAEFGGWTLPAFNVPKVRAILPPDGVGALHSRGIVPLGEITVTVPDTLDRNVRIGLLMHDSLTIADVDHAIELGGVVVNMWPFINSFVVVVEDSILPAFESWARVDQVDYGLSLPVCSVAAPPVHR